MLRNRPRSPERLSKSFSRPATTCPEFHLSAPPMSLLTPSRRKADDISGRFGLSLSLLTISPPVRERELYIYGPRTPCRHLLHPAESTVLYIGAHLAPFLRGGRYIFVVYTNVTPTRQPGVICGIEAGSKTAGWNSKPARIMPGDIMGAFATISAYRHCFSSCQTRFPGEGWAFCRIPPTAVIVGDGPSCRATVPQPTRRRRRHAVSRP